MISHPVERGLDDHLLHVRCHLGCQDAHQGVIVAGCEGVLEQSQQAIQVHDQVLHERLIGFIVCKLVLRITFNKTYL